MYTGGLLCKGLKWPTVRKGVWGYHECMHLIVVLAHLFGLFAFDLLPILE